MKRFHIHLLMVSLLAVGGLKAADEQPQPQAQPQAQARENQHLLAFPSANAVLEALVVEGAVEALANLGDGAGNKLNHELLMLNKSPLAKEELVRLVAGFCVGAGQRVYAADDRNTPNWNDLKAAGKGALASLLVLVAHKVYAKLADLTDAPRKTILNDDASVFCKVGVNLVIHNVADELIERFANR